jgi:MFS family permease
MYDQRTASQMRTGSTPENPFFVFAKPYFDYIGKDKIFHLVYFVMAGINIILPFAVFYTAIVSDLFEYDKKYIIAFIPAWLVIAFACWVGFQLWLDRRKKIIAEAASEFLATLFFSDIVQTFGEWLGTLIAIIGAGAGLIVSVFFGSGGSINLFFFRIGMGFMKYGMMTIIIAPLCGFFIIVLFRFIAEQLRLWATLANHSKHLRFLGYLVNIAKGSGTNIRR